ncbi:serine/threonine protein kinase, partial [bacterium]|nr:serine/threonine protein kinase [bacterium]
STGFIQALNSIENRVFETELEDGQRVVAKFYRPNRWTPEQIAEEHKFTTLLSDSEIPVVAPLELAQDTKLELLGPSLAKTPQGVMFSVYPKVGGRLKDELEASEVRSCAKYIAQIHNIGESLGNSSRRALSIENFIEKPLSILGNGEWMSDEYWTHYEALALQIKAIGQGRLNQCQFVRIHGDCHVGNVIWNWDGDPLFVDFDDMMIGPVVQDLWMLIRGRDQRDDELKNEYLEAYNYFREFDLNQLELIEVLRGMRLIHYSAWIAERWQDPSFPHNFPNFASPGYWQEELQALRDVLERIV